MAEYVAKQTTIPLAPDFLSDELGLIVDEASPVNDFFRLSPNLHGELGAKRSREQTVILNCPDTIQEFFEGIALIKPDKIVRPEGSTTFFTCAGVQHLETILRDKNSIQQTSFMVGQPVVRSQFMDRVREGISTSFVNFSVVLTDASLGTYLDMSSQLIKMVASQPIDLNRLGFHVETLLDQWGSNEFTKTLLTIYYDDVELGESVYIHNYPVSESAVAPVVDIGWGVERLNWAIGATLNYFPGFDKYYQGAEADTIASIIDPIRSMVLMVGEGVIPSSHNHGYRVRSLSKRFTQRNRGVGIDVPGLVDRSYEYWKQWGVEPTVRKELVLETIKRENARNYNSFVLTKGEEAMGKRTRININQGTAEFLKQLSHSIPRDVIDGIVRTIG